MKRSLGHIHRSRCRRRYSLRSQQQAWEWQFSLAIADFDIGASSNKTQTGLLWRCPYFSCSELFMTDLSPRHQLQSNRKQRSALPPQEQPTQIEPKQLDNRDTSDDRQLIENADRGGSDREREITNWLERIVLLVALILLAIAAFNTAIAIYREQHPQPRTAQP